MRALSGMLAAVILLVAPSSGLAQKPLPVGEAHGVRVVREHGGIVVVFTKRAAKLYRRIAGRLVYVECTDQEPSDDEPRAYTFIGPLPPGGITEEASGGLTVRAPQRRRRLVTGDLTRGLDYCRVSRGRRVIVSVPLTQDGAVFLDEEAKSRALARWLSIAGVLGQNLNLSGWPSHAQIVAMIDDSRVTRRLVELPSPTDTPPAHRVGYYSDRREHVAVAVLSKSGKRLFVELAGDVLTTNVPGHIFGAR